MSDRGYIARSRKLGQPANRTLVRQAVACMLAAPGCPLYLHHDPHGHRLVVRAAHPLRGVWRSIGPYDLATTTIAALWEELDYLATQMREQISRG